MKKIYKKLIIVAVMVYFIFTLISQQRMINEYKTAEVNYTKQLEKAKVQKEELTAEKENITSIDYIEKIAREKLGMYLPGETVYIDINK